MRGNVKMGIGNDISGYIALNTIFIVIFARRLKNKDHDKEITAIVCVFVQFDDVNESCKHTLSDGE